MSVNLENSEVALEATQWAPRGPRRGSRGEPSPLLPFDPPEVQLLSCFLFFSLLNSFPFRYVWNAHGTLWGKSWLIGKDPDMGKD